MTDKFTEEFFPGAPLEDLRRVYIKARYSNAEVTKEDAEAAGRLVSDVKSRKVIKDGK